MRPGILAHVDEDRCSGCGVCMENCPFEAIHLVDGKARVVGDCGGCMVCVPACPDQAIAPLRVEALEDEAPSQDPWGFGQGGRRGRHRGW